MTTKYETTYLTDGVWSPTRPSVFVTAKMDGSVDVWDFMFKQNSPTLTVQVSSAPIQSVKFQDSGRLLAVGARDGTTTLVELSESLAKLQPNEKAVFSAVRVSCMTFIHILIIVDAGTWG